MYDANFQARFWAKVALCPHGWDCASCCWLWQGAGAGSPGHLYGLIWAPPAIREQGVRYIKAHRASWEMAYGPIPSGLMVLHDCPWGDNTRCVNFNGHLWLGTDKDNNHDMITKGRQRYPHGVERAQAKITDDDVRTICALRGTVSQAALGKRFGINQATVGDIQRGKKWRHVPRPPFLPIPQGEQVAKLTRTQVYAIRETQGLLTEAVAAEHFGISRAQIHRIWRRQCWGWLPDPQPSAVEELSD